MKTIHWVMIAVAIIGVWLIAMVAASYYGYEYRLPQRIENWKPDTAR
jgi:hypothetical protein